MRAIVPPAMSSPVHEKVHQGAKKEQKKRESRQGVGGMLANQINHGDTKKGCDYDLVAEIQPDPRF